MHVGGETHSISVIFNGLLVKGKYNMDMSEIMCCLRRDCKTAMCFAKQHSVREDSG